MAELTDGEVLLLLVVTIVAVLAYPAAYVLVNWRNDDSLVKTGRLRLGRRIRNAYVGWMIYFLKVKCGRVERRIVKKNAAAKSVTMVPCRK